MSVANERAEQIAFEAEVRRVAEAVWGVAPGECQPAHYTNDPVVREVDGLVRLRDVTHLVMATVSRKLEKAVSDVKKLIAAEKIEARRNIAVKKWFVTREQLDAQHIKHCRENGVEALSLPEFRGRFFDAWSYIAKRRVAAFGSARNLDDESVTLPDNEYIELPLRCLNSMGEAELLNLSKLIQALMQGEIVVLVAPFGAGKSLTAREVFLRLAASRQNAVESPAPVAVNLRDHWGAKYADEILERHAREIGFTPREDVVIAWRAGMLTMILDGFDELAAQAVARSNDRSFMRAARLEALRGVQDLMAKLPQASGVLLTGRDHYFDNPQELIHALGLTGRKFRFVELGEFGESEAAAFLRKKGVAGELPAWLPRKPLLLGYLASKNLLKQILSIDGTQGFGFAWNEFIRRVCEREASQARSAMDSNTLRRLLERLAFDVRSTSSGTGPIAERDLADAYLAETGNNPGDAVLMQLQRLPGLTARSQDPGLRSFIDEDMLSALQGGALARFILEGHTLWTKADAYAPLRPHAVSMAAHLVAEAGGTASVAVSSARNALQTEAIPDQVAADCLEVAIHLSDEGAALDCQGMELEGVSISRVPLDVLRLDRLSVSDSTVDELSVDEVGLKSTCQIFRTTFGKVAGVASAEILPDRIFKDCTFGDFDDRSTNAAIVRSELPPRMKALLTILRKLYLQAGGGRKLNAFKRGLPGTVVEVVDEVVALLRSEALLFITDEVAHPVRKEVSRVRAILNSGMMSKDPVVTRVLSS